MDLLTGHRETNMTVAPYSFFPISLLNPVPCLPLSISCISEVHLSPQHSHGSSPCGWKYISRQATMNVGKKKSCHFLHIPCSGIKKGALVHLSVP